MLTDKSPAIFNKRCKIEPLTLDAEISNQNVRTKKIRDIVVHLKY